MIILFKKIRKEMNLIIILVTSNIQGAKHLLEQPSGKKKKKILWS